MLLSLIGCQRPSYHGAHDTVEDVTSRPRPHARRRAFPKTLIVTALTLLTLTIAWCVTAIVLFVLPKQQALHPADAVVSLAPASKRLPIALEATEQGLAPLLWVSHFPERADSRLQHPSLAAQVCDPDAAEAAQITCFTPATDETIGEARSVAKLIEQSGATHIIVTTNTSHATRAKFIFEHCLPSGTDVQMLLVDEPGGATHQLGRMVYETGAFAKALTEVAFNTC